MVAGSKVLGNKKYPNRKSRPAYNLKVIDKMSKTAVQHVLIPKHKKLSEKDKKELLENYKISVNELPSIFKSDPALLGVEVEAGDVVKIERDSPTAKDTTFYRGVIDG